MVDRLTKIENKIDTLSKEIHEFKSELKTLLSDKINLSSSVKESFIAVRISLKYLVLLFIYILIILNFD
jgi:regulator of replication initiation timing